MELLGRDLRSSTREKIRDHACVTERTRGMGKSYPPDDCYHFPYSKDCDFTSDGAKTIKILLASKTPPAATSLAMSGGVRIFGPNNLGRGDDDLWVDNDLPSGIKKELLTKVQRCYGRVRHVDVGFCFGLLDPLCNIAVGQAIACSEKFLHKLAEVEQQEQKEEEAWLPAKRPMIRCINQRSLDGLVAFLVALFPYLTNHRAMWYLNMADADPLLAARLVINHRGMEPTFGFASDATVAAVEMALRCAAAAAQHPNPRQFALGWKLLSTSLQEVAAVLSCPYATLDPSQLSHIMSLLRQQQPPPVVLSLEKLWELASCRLLNLNLSLGEMNHPVVPQTTMRRRLLTTIELASCRLLNLNPPAVIMSSRLPPLPRPTLRRMLLTTIHGYYLQALALLPKDKLRSHYHHSLLHAGHCYRPLDPVSNIILNTIWYSQAYPLTLEKKVEIKAISAKALLRIEILSLYGLVSFLCTRYPALTPGEALQRLHLAHANLQIAADDPTFLDKYAGTLVPVEEAYAAAAKAAHHPKPLQQAQFLGPSSSMLKIFSLLLKCDEPDNVHPLLLGYLQATVAGRKPEEETKNINVLGPWHYSYVMRMVNDLWNQHNRAVRMVKSAIDLYSQQHGVPKYEIHVICDVNDFVDGPVPVRATPSDCCSHINFLATQTAGIPPDLFFAECRNVGSKGVGLCCPVAMPLPGTEQVRCLHCEFTGSRIVHPAKESFLGRDREFEKMLGGQRVFSERHTNDGIISCSHYKTLWVNSLEEGLIYVDYSCDDNIEEDFPMIDDF